jgi:transposase
VEALGNKKQGHPNMKSERRSPAPQSTVVSDSTQTLREENERLRAEVAYLKKLQALIRAKRSAAPKKRV